jgi:hypothetical protein
MEEHDRKSGEWRADKTSQELLAFVDKLQFGTVGYNAVSDFLDLTRLENDLDSAQADSRNMIEMEIAVAQHDIKQNKSRVKGYAPAYRNFVHLYDSLGESAALDASEMYPDKELDQGVHIYKKTMEFIAQAEVVVMEKRAEL